jgi:hypothetical protein
MILVRPGDTVLVISHDRMAKKYATIAISEMTAMDVSRVRGTLAPDNSNIARNNLGVTARCCRFGASLVSNDFRSARAKGRR